MTLADADREALEDLRLAAQRGVLVPFVGAGVSRLAGAPGWAQLAAMAMQKLVEVDELTHSDLDQLKDLSPRTKLSIARALAADSGIDLQFDELLHPTGTADAIGLRAYAAISALGSTFVTTNFDRWLDTVPPAHLGREATSIDPTSAERSARSCRYRRDEFLPAALSEKDTVIHLHGSVKDPQSMVLTTRDYMEHYETDRRAITTREENRVLTLLEHLFRTKTVLFIGYSLEEFEVLEYVLLKARSAERDAPKRARHFMIDGFFSHQHALKRQLQRYWLNDAGIQLLAYSRDMEDWHGLIRFLEDLAADLPGSSELISEDIRLMDGLLHD